VEQQGGPDDGAARGGRAEREELEDLAVPPSVAGDVDDAVAPWAEGALVRWSPPGQDAGEVDGDAPEGAG